MSDTDPQAVRRREEAVDSLIALQGNHDPKTVRRKEFVDSLIALQENRYELWKYFEDRADRLSERLWSTGVWLMSVVALTLSLPFAAKFVAFPGTGIPVQVSARLPVILVSIFGIAFLVYSYHALHDLRDHIEANWIRASYARTLKLNPADWGGRKRHGWNVLWVVGLLAFLAFAGLLVLACIPAH
jgi:hypothetical protein